MDSEITTPSERKEQTTRTLFDQGCRFKIPSYQRAYSWEVKHLRQLLEDLMEHPEKLPYYYGHFIFEMGEQKDELLIIDGQQRLTTLVLFMAVMVRELDQRADAGLIDSAEWTRRYLSNRLQTVDDDQNVFSDIIQKGGTAERGGSHSKKRLITANRFLARAIRPLDTSTLLAWIGILENAEITTFTVHGKPQAAQIFTLQNSRGKELSNLEKLKALLMFGIYLHPDPARSSDAIKMVERSFASIYRLIESIALNEDTVLGHHDRAYSPFWDTPLENIKKQLSASKGIELRVQEITDFAKALAATFQHVADLEQMAAKDDVIADPIILDGTNSWPLLIKLYCYHGEAVRNDPQIRQLLQNVEIVLLKLRFQHGRSSNDLLSKTKWLNKSPGHLNVISTQMEGFVSCGFRGRNDFNLNVQRHLDGDWHYGVTYRYILWKYENDQRSRGDMVISPEDYMNSVENRRMDSTIEHIAPQNGDYTEEFRKRWINNLGNLLLMPRGMNASLSDRPPIDKARDLDTSYKSHREVRATILESGWAEDHIKRRKEVLVRFIQRRWRLPQAVGSVAEAPS